jgi:hypothetical protein
MKKDLTQLWHASVNAMNSHQGTIYGQGDDSIRCGNKTRNSTPMAACNGMVLTRDYRWVFMHDCVHAHNHAPKTQVLRLKKRLVGLNAFFSWDLPTRYLSIVRYS